MALPHLPHPHPSPVWKQEMHSLKVPNLYLNTILSVSIWASLGAQWFKKKNKNLPAYCRRHGFSLWVGKIPLGKGMATHSRILA